jgi:hypothetical protein
MGINPLWVQKQGASAPGVAGFTAVPRGTGLIWTTSRRRSGLLVTQTLAPPSAKLDSDQQKFIRMSNWNGKRVSCLRVKRISPKDVQLKSGRSSIYSKVLKPNSGRLLRSSDEISNRGSNSKLGGAREVVSIRSMNLCAQSLAATRWHHKETQ